jgi:DNA helicase-2/ATP-dependent DNA helicase PcrA
MSQKYSKFPPKKPNNSHIVKHNPKRNWSDYQKAIFKDINKNTDHTVVIARAGSGKTSTIIEGFKYIPKGKKTLMVAFNKAIADELKQRAPSYVETSTLHALGYRAIRQRFGNDVVLENHKMQLIFEDIIGKDDWDLTMQFCKCASLCKGFLFDTPTKISELIDNFGIDIGDFEQQDFIKHIIKGLSICKTQTQIIDFDDMIYFPFIFRLNVGKYDVVFVDEAQDLNSAQMAMVLSANKVDGRIIAVGDPAQSIYQFRGADSQAISNFVSKLHAKTLPLSVSYRCPKKVVALAQQIVPDIEAAPDAPDGIVIDLPIEDLLKTVKPGDFVLSRTNAPLIKYCLRLLRAGVPANIQGRDIGSNLQYFIKKSKAKTINAFIDYVNEWRQIEVKRLLSEKKNTEICIDKSECLLNLCEGTLTIKDLKETIDKLFNDVDDAAKIMFSTTHKAKGLERDRVFILTGTYRYGPGVEGEEANLFYVAITRAKKELYFVSKDDKYRQYDNRHISGSFIQAINDIAMDASQQYFDDSYDEITDEINYDAQYFDEHC